MSVLTLPNADRLALSVRAKALVFEDPRSRALLRRIEQVAPSQAPVLITGETGTGKEIVARHLHELSRRRRLGIERAELCASARARLLGHAWPGNIRELENALHHALLVCQHGEIAAEDLGLPGGSAARAPRAASGASAALEAALLALFEQNVPHLHEHVEHVLMRSAYRYCHDNQLQTARLLGVSRNVVRARLIQYGELHGTLRGPSQRRASEPPSRALSWPAEAAIQDVRARVGRRRGLATARASCAISSPAPGRDRCSGSSRPAAAAAPSAADPENPRQSAGTLRAVTRAPRPCSSVRRRA